MRPLLPLLLSLTSAASALAALTPPEAATEPVWRQRVFALGRINPEGLHVGYQVDRPLPQRPGIDSGHVGLRVAGNLSYGALRLAAEWSPHPAVVVGSHYRLRSFWGTYTGLIDFAGPDADYSRDVLDAREDEADSGVGHDLGVDLNLRGRAGRFVLLLTGAATWYDYPSDAPVVYEPDVDLLTEDGDTVLDVRALPLWTLTGPEPPLLLVGPAGRWQRALGTGLDRQQVGLAGLYRHEAERTWDLSMLLWHNVEDPMRDGEWSLEAALGLTF